MRLRVRGSTHTNDYHGEQRASQSAHHGHSARRKPDGGGDIDPVAAGKPNENKLSDADNGPGAQQYEDMPPSSSARCGIQDISSRASPDKMLNDFQKSGQYDRAHARTDSDAQDPQLKARGPGLKKSRWYFGLVGLGHRIRPHAEFAQSPLDYGATACIRKARSAVAVPSNAFVG